MDKIIVALDFSDREETLSFLNHFSKPIFVKVGMELFYKYGEEIIREIKRREHKIFLDLKLHDIPNTVKKAIKNLTLMDVDMINVHCAGGREMMMAGKEGIEEALAITGRKNRPIYIGVTQLTSTSKAMMNKEQGIDGNVIDSVLRYSYLAKDSGLDGVVSSVHEVEEIHRRLGENFITVTPGIRICQDDKNDQKRVATPSFAKKSGSDLIVVGRSITKSNDPINIYEAIKNEFQ